MQASPHETFGLDFARMAIVAAALAVLSCGGGSGDKDAAASDGGADAAEISGEVLADVPTDVPADNGRGEDTGKDGGPGDSGGKDSNPGDSGQDDAGPGDESGDLGPDFGFDIRVPETHSLECTGGGMPGGPEKMDVLDTDWICTFDYAGMSGHVYVQSTPAACVVLWDALPEFDSQGWISLDGKVSELAGEYYDWGGNHNNDYFEFDFDGKHYRYYHSSCGFGWRKCFPMDCIVVSAPGGGIIEDGCGEDRSLPAVCMPIKEDGTYDPLIDAFEKCPGDQGPC